MMTHYMHVCMGCAVCGIIISVALLAWCNVRRVYSACIGACMGIIYLE